MIIDLPMWHFFLHYWFINCISISISEWVVKIPIILIMGVATTLDAPRNILPSNVLQQLCPCKFVLGSPAERMDTVIEAALLRQCSMFSIGHKVAAFLRNYFLNQDGTVTSFIRALKVCCLCYADFRIIFLLYGTFYLMFVLSAWLDPIDIIFWKVFSR